MIHSRISRFLIPSFFILGLLAPELAPRSAGAAESHGPTLALGLSDEDEGDVIHTGVGWRWEFAPGRTFGDFAQRIGLDLNWAVEPQAAILSNDRDGVEFQVVPYFQLSPRSMSDYAIRPYLEGGIGLIYIDVTGFDLGSQILFSDNLGIRLDLGGNGETPAPWSLAYRYRHISHAGLWAESNSGMNTHWLTLTYRMLTH